MGRLKILRLACAGIEAIALLGLFGYLPVLFTAQNHGEVSTIKFLCVVIGSICLLVGMLRFALSTKGRGVSFLMAVAAFSYALLSISPFLRSPWLELALLGSVMGVIIDFWPAAKAESTGPESG